jgi:hypothetical protein
MPLDQSTRFRVRQFLKDRQGEYDAFYLWPPDPNFYEDVAAGTATAQSVFILPFRTTNPYGGVIGSLSDVRVAGISKAFTRRALLPRTTTFAAMRFEGVSSYVDCGSSSTLRGVGDMSVGGWVYGFDWASPRTIIANRVLNASGIILYVAPGGALTFATNFASSNSTAASSFTLPTDAWTHVMVTRTNGGPAIFYKNGVAFNTSASLTNPATATVSFKIGCELSSANPFFGMLNDLRVYSSVVSPAEVLNIVNNAATTPTANLTGWWRLTEGTGTTVTDLSGNANAGTLTGPPLWVAGEDEVTFTGGVQTGAVTAWGLLRERVVARYDGASRRQRFVGSTPLTSIDLAFQELY